MKLVEFFSLKNDNPIKPQPPTPPISVKDKWVLVDRKEIRKNYEFSEGKQRCAFIVACLRYYDQSQRPLERFQLVVEGFTVTFRLFGSDALGLMDDDLEVAKVFEGIYEEARAGVGYE